MLEDEYLEYERMLMWKSPDMDTDTYSEDEYSSESTSERSEESEVFMSSVDIKYLGFMKEYRGEFSYKNLKKMVEDMNDSSISEPKISEEPKIEFIDLSIDRCDEKACVIVIKSGVNWLMKDTHISYIDILKSEHDDLIPNDRYSKNIIDRICNIKDVRIPYNISNIVFSYDSDIKNGVISLDDVDMTYKLGLELQRFFKLDYLDIESDYYEEISEYGIGYHGESNVNVKIGAILGATIPLHFQWYRYNVPCLDKISVDLEDGDIYIISDKAVGFDCKTKSKYILRHASGANIYTKRVNII